MNSSLFAQNQISIGFDLIPQITSIVGENDFIDSQTDYRKADYNIGLGLTFDYFFTEQISINSGIRYNPQGIKKEKVTIDPYGERFFQSDIGYLRIPLNATYYLNKTNDLRIKIAAGMGFNYLLHVTDNLGDVINFVNTILKEPEDRYNKIVIDAVASIGLDYNLTNKMYLTTDLEGLIGLNKFHKSYSLGTNADIDIDSKIFSLGIKVGLRYILKKNPAANNTSKVMRSAVVN